MNKKLIGKKARIIGLLIMLSAVLAFSNAVLQSSIADHKHQAFIEYFSQKEPLSKENEVNNNANDFIKDYYQRGFDKFDSQQQERFKSNIDFQKLAASIFWYLAIFYGLVGVVVWAQKDVALKLFYPSVCSMIVCQLLLNFFTYSTNAMSYEFSQGLLSQIITTFLASLVSITMILNLVLIIVVPLMTDKVEQQEG